MTDAAISTLAPLVGTRAACAALGEARARYYRRHRKSPAPERPVPVRTPQPRALSEAERSAVLEVLHHPDHVDEAPATVYAKLLDEGTYLASTSTMYRLLRANAEVRERRRQATHPAAKKPELLASGPNEVWSWDITKLLGPEKWNFFYLYVVIDIYSRYVVGWMLARAERAKLAEALLADSIAKQGINPGQLTIHADRGTSMASKPVAFLLADLGVTKSHNRPHCSNDNPYSESQFRTLKYQPSFPARFGSFEDAHAFCRRFFSWYNADHRHSGIGFHTPADVHYGRAELVRAQRGLVLGAAYAAHPERFVRKPPAPPALPTVAWINQPEEDPPAQYLFEEVVS
jgi:putative transposase